MPKKIAKFPRTAMLAVARSVLENIEEQRKRVNALTGGDYAATDFDLRCLQRAFCGLTDTKAWMEVLLKEKGKGGDNDEHEDKE